MKCKKCSGEIPSNSLICPYCHSSVSELKRNDFNRDFKEDIDWIDRYFGIKDDLVKMDSEKISNYFQQIFAKFNDFEEMFKNNENKLNEVYEKIENLDIQFQSKFPIREKALKGNKEGSVENVVNELLSFEPPEVYAAAFKIRSSIERKLKDDYKFPYGIIYVDPKGRKTYGFKMKYFNMFKKITHRNDVASKLFKDHIMLNKFIHEGEENDKEIKLRYPTIYDQVNFIKKTLNLSKEFNILK